MLRALTVALLCASTVASAEEPAAEDPKAAIAERGIVLKAGKRHFFVIVPRAVNEPTVPADATMFKSRMLFGTAKSLSEFGVFSWTQTSIEERGLGDDRGLYGTSIRREGATYTLVCAPGWDDSPTPQTRTIALTPGTRADVEGAVIAERITLRDAFVLARVRKTTTYIYVDARNGREHRMFMGKRGAMKQIAIKEMASDASSTLFVTAKGTLTVVPARTPNEAPALTFGSAKKQATLESLKVYAHRKLIYFDLGIYTRERTGHPCDEL